MGCRTPGARPRRAARQRRPVRYQKPAAAALSRRTGRPDSSGEPVQPVAGPAGQPVGPVRWPSLGGVCSDDRLQHLRRSSAEAAPVPSRGDLMSHPSSIKLTDATAAGTGTSSRPVATGPGWYRSNQSRPVQPVPRRSSPSGARLWGFAIPDASWFQSPLRTGRGQNRPGPARPDRSGRSWVRLGSPKLG